MTTSEAIEKAVTMLTSAFEKHVKYFEPADQNSIGTACRAEATNTMVQAIERDRPYFVYLVVLASKRENRLQGAITDGDLGALKRAFDLYAESMTMLADILRVPMNFGSRYPKYRSMFLKWRDAQRNRSRRR